jgi:hypothetical protein
MDKDNQERRFSIRDFNQSSTLIRVPQITDTPTPEATVTSQATYKYGVNLAIFYLVQMPKSYRTSFSHFYRRQNSSPASTLMTGY